MGKTYLFYFNWQMEIPFYGIVLHELNKLIKDIENEVYILSCDGVLRNCFVNKTTDRAICKVCQFAKKVGDKPYRNRVKMINIGDWLKMKDTDFPVFSYENIDDIKKLVYKECFIGYGALSSYVSYTRNQEPLIDSEFRKYFNDLLISQMMIINAMENLFMSVKFDEIFLYNGRWADVRPVFDIGIREGVWVNVLESVNNGTTSFDREIYANALPQDILYRNEIINRIWDESKLDYTVKEKMASDFYTKRKNADFVRGDFKVFTSDQQLDKLPANWDSSKINISIFNSSEDEFVAAGIEWEKYRIFQSQEKGLHEILSMFKENEKYHFYLRIHPNLARVQYGYHKRLLHLGEIFCNVTVIPGESSVSTYKLIEQSEKVIVFGSTVGAEACFWRKPAILLGSAFYYFQDVCYQPSTIEEIKGMILSNLKPKPVLGALKFGFYLLNHHLYTETISLEPYPLKVFNKTLGFGFKHMLILKSPLLFKIVYKFFQFLTFRVYRGFIKNKNVIPIKGI